MPAAGFLRRGSALAEAAPARLTFEAAIILKCSIDTDSYLIDNRMLADNVSNRGRSYVVDFGWFSISFHPSAFQR